MTERPNWIQSAARSIAIEVNKQGPLWPEADKEAFIANVISLHSPFRPNVMYMPVPQCATCVHWNLNKFHKNYGACILTEGRDSDGFGPKDSDTAKAVACTGGDEFGNPILATMQDFGCTEWKKKP